MKEEFKREDLIFCIGLIREGFLQVGYKEEKDRIQAIAKGLLKSWKRKWSHWDKYDLQNNFSAYVISGLGKIVLPEIVSSLHGKYKLVNPKPKEALVLNRVQIEEDYLKEIIRRIEQKDYFPQDTHWREFSLFHVPMEMCREFIPGEYFAEFERLKGELKTKENSPSLIKGMLGGKTSSKSKTEIELVKCANEILCILHFKL